MRQTHGWVDKRTKARKTRDRISHSQFVEKTGLSRRIITQTIPTLLRKGLIAITDLNGRLLNVGRERTGRTHMFYSSTCALFDNNLGTFRHQPEQKGGYNKTNYTKLNKTKLREGSSKVVSVGDVIGKMAVKPSQLS